MSQPRSKSVHCPLIVLHIDEAQMASDTLADALRDELLTVYLRSEAVHAVIDLAQVGYLASAGIRPLLALKRQVSQHEGRLILSGLTPDVEGVFVATRLISTSGAVAATFEHSRDVPAAVAALYQLADGSEQGRQV